MLRLLKEQYRILILCCVLAFLEFRIVAFIHQWNFEDVVRVSLGPVQGSAYWRAFQNKLLSGWICLGIAAALHVSDRLAFIIFGVLTLAVTNMVSYATFLLLTNDRRRALEFLGYGVGLFVLLQDGRWIMGWDFLDLLLFTALAYGIATDRRWPFTAWLFVPALFTRETALFIPVWLVLRAFFEKGRGWRVQALAGGLAIVLGAAVIKVLRDHLFTWSPYENIGTDEAHRLFGNFFTLPRNLVDFVDNILRLHFDLAANLFVILVLWWVYRSWRQAGPRERALALLLLCMMGSVFLVGIINETRNWLTMIPLFLVNAAMSLAKTEKRGIATEAQRHGE